MKKALAAILAMLVILTTACGTKSNTNSNTNTSGGTNTNSGSTATVVVRIGTTVTDRSNYGIGVVKLAELINERSNGRFDVQHAGNSMLGGERDMCEGVLANTIQGVVSSSTVMANFVPMLNCLELPYLFDSYEQAYEIMSGEVGQELVEACDDAGYKCFGIWLSGFRNLYTADKPIESVEDVAGIKVRVMENAMHQALWRALGADAVTMSWTDGYTSMQQNAIDGIEVPCNLASTQSVADVATYFNETKHILTLAPFCISKSLWDSMSAEDQALWEECAAEALAYQWEECAKFDDECADILVNEQGMTKVTPDLAPFKEMTRSLIEEAQKDSVYGALVTKIVEITG